MVEQVIDLNYDFNYNLFLAKSLIGNLATPADRQKVGRWMRKLIASNRTIEEIKLRNDFMYYLVLNVQSAELRPPFSNPPPSGPLPAFATLLPGGPAAEPEGQWAEADKTKSMLYQNSPDGGAFLASQPIPRCGAFCYLAVLSRAPK